MEEQVKTIPYFRPSIGQEERKAVDDVLASGWLTSGRVVKRFEEKFAAYIGMPRAVAVNSCTAGLHLALEALGVGRGDAVLVPAMTFTATAAVVCHLGARPVLVDCDEETLCIDPEDLKAKAAQWAGRGGLKAIIAMHYGGQMADMARVAEVAAATGVPVVEDAAHALPAYYRKSADHPWQSVGATSAVTCFSFYANKCITTGEGGMAVTGDAEIADRMRVMSLHGLSRSAWNRFQAGGSWYYEVASPGFKYNMTDVAAAIGIEQLEKADHFCHLRTRVSQMYADRLEDLAGLIELPTLLENRRSSWHIYPIRMRPGRLGIDRAEFIQALAARGVTCSVHWMPLHLHPHYRDAYGYRPEDFPVASRVWPRLVSLPIFPDMTPDEVEYVCDSVRDVVEEHRVRRSVFIREAVA